MRFVTFAHQGRTRPGFLQDGQVTEIACESLGEYIALDPSQRATRLGGPQFALQSVTLLAPLHPRKNVFCVGRNYLEHAKEGARASGRELKLPDVPTFFTKAPTAIAGPDETLDLRAAVSREYDWEGELAVIIGTRIKDADEASALGAVFGYRLLKRYHRPRSAARARTVV